VESPSPELTTSARRGAFEATCGLAPRGIGTLSHQGWSFSCIDSRCGVLALDDRDTHGLATGSSGFGVPPRPAHKLLATLVDVTPSLCICDAER
jgi:hypothetical protein